jgi:hypothetical protein
MRLGFLSKRDKGEVLSVHQGCQIMISVSIHVYFPPIPHESAHIQGVMNMLPAL